MAVATTRTKRGDLVASVREVAAATYVWTIGLLAAIVLVGGVAGYTPVVITSGSMQPAIRAGDVVLLRAPGGDPPAPPSVVTFTSASGQLVTHRVIDTHPDGSFVTKGDANATADSTPVRSEDLAGVGRWLVPYVGLPVLWLRTGNLLALTAFVLVTVAMANLARRRRAHPDDHEERRAAARRRRHRARRRRTTVVTSLVAIGLAVPVTTSSAALTASTSAAGSFAAASSKTLVRHLGPQSEVDTVTEPLLALVSSAPTLSAPANRSMDRDDRPGRWLESGGNGPAGRIVWRGVLPDQLRRIDGEVTVEVTAVAGPHAGQGAGPAPRLELSLAAYDLDTGASGTELASAQQELPRGSTPTTVVFVFEVDAELAASEGLEIALETQRRDVDVFFATTDAPSQVTIDVSP